MSSDAGGVATAHDLRDAIVERLTRLHPDDLRDECVELQLDPPRNDLDNPWNSKAKYVERRIRGLDLPALVTLGRKVDQRHGAPELRELLSRTGIRGVDGAVKNLIFASNGSKPDIVLADAVSNDLRIVGESSCLNYDLPVGEEGLTWDQLVSWWATQPDGKADEGNRPAQGHGLYRRLMASVADSGAERCIFRTYCALYASHGWEVPALIPQVYLHYDPLAQRRDRRRPKPLTRQRMDFLLLLSERRRVVIELDGKQHYADDEIASPAKYAEMVAADRRLQLAGYEVYRIGGAELVGHDGSRRDKVEAMLTDLFLSLLSLPSRGH